MAQRISDFSVWRQGFAGATVTVYKANTTTLADLFFDVDAAIPAGNPQVLDSLEISGELYGRFQQPIYIAESYYLDIDDGTQTGVTPYPIFSLDGENATTAVVIPDGGSVESPLGDILGRVIWAADHGPIDSVDSVANTTAIQTAINVVAAYGAGTVILPPGNIPFTKLTLPAGVLVMGFGRDATVLQSALAQEVVEVTGDFAGFSNLTLDGISLQALSVGVKSRSRQHFRLHYVTIKRFETLIDCKGSRFADWKELRLSNGGTHLKGWGDSTDTGAEHQYNVWDGGVCELASALGIDLSFEDKEVSFNQIRGVLFDSNAKAIRINGARFTVVEDCQFTNNPIVFDILDDTATTGNNKVYGLTIARCILNTGAFNARDTLGDVKLVSCDIRGVTFTLTTPANAIAFIDCVEDATVVIAGDGTKIVRSFSDLPGSTKGVTTGSAATKAWSLKLVPGEMCAGRVMVTGKQRNGVDKASYVFTFTAQRAPSTLAYDAQTGNFTVGLVLTGVTSGATGRIIADSDGGTTGTLTLHTISGIFVDNETIQDGAGGVALANGALVVGSVAILDQDVQSTSETDAAWDCVAAGSTEEAEVRVTGATGKTVDWVVFVTPSRYG